ncbi:MAG TPA: hypothetical protein VMG10_30260 [Gemmataceae bacterium]|nr:hypothetical protein [Gemmataceae bacterium]
MRRILFRAAGICLASLGGLTLAGASELDSKPAVPGAAVRPVKPIALKKDGATCGSHGTQVEFLDTPSEAAKVAKKEQKLVFVLHVSGNFEDPRFT